MAHELTNPVGLADVRRALNPKPLLAHTKRSAVRLNDSSAAGLLAYETWLGGPAGGLLAFCNGGNGAHDTMANVLLGAAAEIATFSALGRPVLWTVAPCTDQPGEGGLDVLAGMHDAYLDTIFQQLAAANPTGEIWVRLGHEMNFWTAYPWGAAFLAPSQYVALWQYVVDRARAITDRFRWAWCPNWNVRGSENADIDPTPWYPGDGYVDFIAPDVYMQYAGVITDAGRNVQQAINYMFTATYGLDWFARFAALRGKRLMLSEWGIDDDRLSGFINRIYEWVDENPVEFFAYWDKNSPAFSCRISDGSKPNAEAAYRPAFKGSPVAWTPQLEFGQNLFDFLDFTDAGSVTQNSGAVASIANKGAGSPGAYENATANQRPAYSATARNGKGGATFDGSNDNLIQTVMSTLSPAQNEEKTTFIQGYLDPASTGFQYVTAEADGGTNRRSIGFNNGVIRLQAVGGVPITATTKPVVNSNVKGVDASIIALYGSAYNATYHETVQVSVNGSWLTTSNRNHQAAAVTSTRRILGADAAASAGLTGYAPYVVQFKGEISFRISQRIADRLSGWLAWQLGRQADLRADHPYKAAAPQYGLPAV